MEKRIDELEAKLAFAEDLLDTLNETVVRQQREIDKLHYTVLKLAEQLRQLPGNEPRRLEDEMPPHY